MKKIGWIGLGAMGIPMASNVIKAGFELMVYNRTKEKEQSLLSEGAKSASNPKEVAEKSDCIVLMVTNGQATKEVLSGDSGVISGLKQGQIVVNMSTIGPDDSRASQTLVQEAGGIYVEAPVSGSVGPAINKQLLILAGGNQEAVEKLNPLFDSMGRKTLYFGEVGSGTAAKLVINQLLALTMQSISESLILGERLGLEKAQVIEMIENSAVNTPILQGKKELLLKEDYPSAFALKLMLKDLNLIFDEMQQYDIPLPATSAAQSTFSAAKANGNGDKDLSAVYDQLKHMAGLKKR